MKEIKRESNMEEITPGCYEPGPEEGRCAKKECELYSRCLEGKGKPPRLVLEYETPLQIGKEGLGTGQKS